MLDAYSQEEPTLSKCEHETVFSYTFDLIHPHAGDSTACSRSPLYRICSLMRKMNAQAYVREELVSNSEIDDEVRAAGLRTGGQVSAKAVRFTFFREWPESGNWNDLHEDSCLGYFVDLALKLPNGEVRRYVLESVVRPPSRWLEVGGGNGGHYEPVPNSYIHCCREFQTVVGTPQHNRVFTLWGSFFCQQNDLTHCCAHAALRMAVNSSPINPRAAAAPIVDQGKLTNQYINDRLGIDWHPATRPHIGHYAPDGNDGGGLTTEQIQQIVTGLGWQIHSADFMEQPSIDYDRYIYPLVESGCPAILAIMRPGVAHVVAVHGHTLNSDRWTPEARTGYGGLPLYPHTPTSAWSDHFVISDDNFGMYVTLPTEEIRNLLVPKYNPNLHAAHAIGLVPQGVETPGYFVEQKSAWFAGAFVSQATPGSGNRWFTELKRNEKQLVCRTLLAAKEPYLRDVTQWLDEGKLRVLAEAIPDSFWVTEITTPDLYQTNKTKLGDVIARIDAPISTNNLLDGLVFAWLPEIAVQVNGWKIYPDWPIDRHVPLFRREAAAFRVFEW